MTRNQDFKGTPLYDVAISQKCYNVETQLLCSNCSSNYAVTVVTHAVVKGVISKDFERP